MSSLAVVGMGYVGLPLAVTFAESGVKVCGLDLSSEKMGMLNEGESYIEDIPTPRLAPLVSKGLVRGSTDFDDLADADCISICVPTPLSKTRDPEMSYVLAATKEIAPRLRKGQAPGARAAVGALEGLLQPQRPSPHPHPLPLLLLLLQGPARLGGRTARSRRAATTNA